VIRYFKHFLTELGKDDFETVFVEEFPYLRTLATLLPFFDVTTYLLVAIIKNLKVRMFFDI